MTVQGISAMLHLKIVSESITWALKKESISKKLYSEAMLNMPLIEKDSQCLVFFNVHAVCVNSSFSHAAVGHVTSQMISRNRNRHLKDESFTCNVGGKMPSFWWNNPQLPLSRLTAEDYCCAMLRYPYL